MGLIDRYAQPKEAIKERLLNEFGIEEEDNDARVKKTNAKKKQNRERYTQGVWVEGIPTQYGDMIKVAINKEMFCNNNYVTDGGYISFFIKKNPNGGYYAENTNYKKNS